MSIITLEKPVPRVSESDWYFKVAELKDACDKQRVKAFELNNESHRLRNDADVTTEWSTHRTNNVLDNRCTEIKRWTNLFEILYENVRKEINGIKEEKFLTEQIIEFLNMNFSVVNHCLSIRDERGGADLCYDSVSVELKTEQQMLELLKSSLTGICQMAWEQINKLQELLINIGRDIDNKNKTINIDTELLKMTKNSLNICRKPDPWRVRNDVCTYEKWIRQSNNLKQRVEKELMYSRKLRDGMYEPRNNTKTQLRGQNDNVNSALRKRIYETAKMKDELEWQKLNMEADMAKFSKEIENLEKALDNKLNSKKLVDTRCEERLYRIGDELCHDITTTGLLKENILLESTTRNLVDKLTETKRMYNHLTGQLNVIKEELVNKTHALKVDQKCLEHRKDLKGRYAE